MYVYFHSLHVSGNHVPIIRRINCISAIPLCVDDRLLRPHRVTYTTYHTDTVDSPDYGHMFARNMYKIEINIHETFVRPIGLFTGITHIQLNL